MSFKDEMNDLAVELIELDPDFSTISIEVLHRKPISHTYNEATGKKFALNSDTIVTAIVGPFVDTQENAQDFQVGDLKMICAFKTMEQVPEPQNDLMVLPDNNVYRVLSVSLDSSQSVYIIQLRLSNDKQNNGRS